MSKFLPKWHAYTPGGTMCPETEARTERECIKKLIEATSHMPYNRSWENLKKRGYTVEKWVNG